MKTNIASRCVRNDKLLAPAALHAVADRQTYRQTNIQTDKHTDRQTYRQTDIQTDKHTDRQTYRQTDKTTSPSRCIFVCLTL